MTIYRVIPMVPLVLISLAALPATVAGRSFDCAKAASMIEMIVKGVPSSEQSKLRGEQRGWLDGRNDCSSRGCVSFAYTQQNSRLDGLIGDARTSVAPPVATQRSPETGERLSLMPGQPPVARSGTVVGDASVTYVVPGRKGQTLVLALKSASTSVYFNVLPIGDPTAIYASATEASGNTGSVVFPADGDYRVVVYLFRNAARRGAKAAFTLSAGLK